MQARSLIARRRSGFLDLHGSASGTVEAVTADSNLVRSQAGKALSVETCITSGSRCSLISSE
jgi:hypothetical protein